MNNFATFMVGTHNEMIGCGDFREYTGLWSKYRSERDAGNWDGALKTQREIGSLNPMGAPEDERFAVIEQFYGVLAYTGIAVATAAVAPMVRFPLLCDATLRLYRTFTESTPIGIMGTARELLEDKI
jgi:hypothetical protein